MIFIAEIIPYFIDSFFLDFKKLLKSPFNNPYTDANIPAYLIKGGAVFGEFDFDNTEKIGCILIIMNFLLVIISIILLIYTLLKGRMLNPMQRFGPAIIWCSSMITYYIFNYNYPYGCTMDFRYVLQTAFCGAYYIGIGLYILTENHKTNNSIIGKLDTNTLILDIKQLVAIVLCTFCIFSIIFFITFGFFQ